MRTRRNMAILAALAILLAWWLATPGAVTGGLGDEDLTGLKDLPTKATNEQITEALQVLYEREAWSASFDEEAPEGAEGQGDATEQEAPEGLDRFTLIGIIRVQGQEPEAILLDAAASDNEQTPSFKAREGERLRDTQVRLESIEGARVKLQLATDTRWLELFQRPVAREAAEQTQTSE